MPVRMVGIGPFIGYAHKHEDYKVCGKIAQRVYAIGNKGIAMTIKTYCHFQHHKRGIDPKADPCHATYSAKGCPSDPFIRNLPPAHHSTPDKITLGQSAWAAKASCPS